MPIAFGIPLFIKKTKTLGYLSLLKIKKRTKDESNRALYENYSNI